MPNPPPQYGDPLLGDPSSSEYQGRPSGTSTAGSDFGQGAPQQDQNLLFGPGPGPGPYGGPGQPGGPNPTSYPGSGPTLASTPAIDIADTNPGYTAGGAFIQNQQAGSQAAQQQALQSAQQLYQGKGPSLATQLLQQQANRSMANQNAMASSASGSGSALARRQAMMTNANTMQDLGSQAGTARAQEQLGALGQMGQLAGQSRAQDLAMAGGQEGVVQNQAGLNLQNYGIGKGAQMQGNAMQMQGAGAAMAGVGTMLSFADMPGNASGEAAGLSLKEPGGPSHWIIREEPTFLLAANARTGEFRKILTAPLTPEEHSQAMKKHGAGPVGSPNPANLNVVPGQGMVRGGDVDMGNSTGAAVDSTANMGWDASGRASAAGYDVSQGAGAAGGQVNQTTQPQAQKKKNPIGAAGDKLSSTSIPAGYQGGGQTFASDPAAMGDAAAKAVARGGDVNMGGGTPQSYGQQFRQQYIDSTAKTETEAGDVTFGGPPQAPQQTGADRLIASMRMNQDPNAGYNPANLKKTVNPDVADQQNDEAISKMDVLDFSKWLGDKYPDADVGDLQHRFAAEPNFAARQSNLRQPAIDQGATDPAKGPKNLNRGGPATDEGGEGAVEMPELTVPNKKSVSNYNAISADFKLGSGDDKDVLPPKKGQLKGTAEFGDDFSGRKISTLTRYKNGKVTAEMPPIVTDEKDTDGVVRSYFRPTPYQHVGTPAGDVHLGKGKFNVDPPKARSTMPKTGGALRGLTSFYGKGPSLDSPSKANSMLTKNFSKPRMGTKAA